MLTAIETKQTRKLNARLHHHLVFLQNHIAKLLLLVVGLFFTSIACAETAHGSTFFLPYSKDKVIPADLNKNEVGDSHSGHIFVFGPDSLEAYRPGEVQALYTLQAPDDANEKGQWIISATESVVYLSPDKLIGYSKPDGKRKFEIAKSPSFKIPNKSVSIFTNGEEGHFLYLADEQLVPSNIPGKDTPVALRAPIIAKYDLNAGRKLWERNYAGEAPNAMVRGVTFGSVNVAADGGPPIKMAPNVLDHFASGGQDFSVKLAQPFLLTALKAQTHEEEWTAEGFPPLISYGNQIERMFGRTPIFEPVLKNGTYFGTWHDKKFTMVDLNKRKVLFTVDYKFKLVRSKNHILAVSQYENVMRCLNPETGETVWEFPANSILQPEFAGSIIVGLKTQDLQKNWTMSLFWLDPQTGKEQYRWNVPSESAGDIYEVDPTSKGWKIVILSLSK